MDGKLTREEALSISVLESDTNWARYKEYIHRQYRIAMEKCSDTRDDHRFHQGRTLELKQMVLIEDKAKNILQGE